ncbi:hypothetical protein GP486_000019 [Trichoglossum hirsutum]|uniref:Heterokaryon incompatibility domain-containing protein n=1 Tax=Trichoglossum hirsutum TaxID=265104 RepID=A0A9P8LJR2_9PEZI|nr:hypothetical protein GP486_000019 [Trichoglossum hirsutum]
MEHLLTPAESRPISIPYVGGEEFERSNSQSNDIVYNFKTYWERKGWERHPETGDLLFKNRSPQDIVQSLQTSLYFGTLISIFARVGIPVRTRDFLDSSSPGGEIFVRTTKLPDLIADWTKREGFSERPLVFDVNSPRLLRSENIREMLNWTFYYLNMFRHESKAMAEPCKSRMQLVELSIMAMAESLCSVIAAIYGYDAREMPTWGSSPVLKAQLRDNGWCVSDSPFFPESMTRAAISTDYYFSSFVCPRPRGDHSKCTMAICNEYCKKITIGEYQQKHVAHDCKCKPIQVPKEAINLVAERQIPVLQWDGKTIRVSAGGTQNNWSDGLGNDDKINSLWACQLSRIQLLVNELYSRPHRALDPDHAREVSREDGIVSFWIDTLCVPVGEENRHAGGDDKRDLRKEAISQMADVYRLASRVLVLDSFILTLPCSADVVDKYLRIHLSTWHHRLWTMQEGQLASRLFFQFRDGAESFNDMKLVGLQSFDRFAPRNLCSPTRLLCAVELEAFYRGTELGADTSRDIMARMRSCARYLRGRETSRSEDEPVCVANILGLDAGRVLDQDGADARMACFYDLVGQFDPRIIFHDHPRLPTDGYRWAPRSFLRQLPDVINFSEGGLEAGFTPSAIIPGGGGLPVRFGGFEFSGDSLLQPGSPVYIQPITDGRGWAPKWLGGSRTPWFACTFKMEVQDVLGSAPPPRPGQRWVVILPGCLEKDFLGFSFGAVMGIIDADIPPYPTTAWQAQRTVWTTYRSNYGIQLPAYSVPYRIPVRYVCRAKVTMPAREEVPQNVSFIGVWAYSIQQEWCLR